jgi:uncharacterized protein (DUF1015 family)
MTEIKPFKAVHYNKEKVGDLSKVVCPPYDVITKDEQNDYHNANEYNFIRIILGKDQPGDDGKNNKYTRAKKVYQDWLDSGILVEDSQPCIYYYKQEYKVLGEKHSRLGFISLMKIEDDQTGRIFPHENTHMKAKEDRLRLWSLLASNLSPIFVCFSDSAKTVEKIFQNDLRDTPPLINIKDEDQVRHYLWRLTDPKLIEQIVTALADQQLFIADGHHRYEVAREYCRQQKEKGEHHSGEEPFNYLMTYFTDINSRDLQIFPMHRILRKISLPVDLLEEFFRIDKLKNKSDLALLLAKAGKNEHAFGLYSPEGIRLLRLKNKSLIDKYVTEGSADFRRLDATILKFFIFDRVGVASEDIIYTHDLNRAFDEVDTGVAAASFILNPVKISQLKAIALNGERMPPKTTYFYPKVLSGLTVHKMK